MQHNEAWRGIQIEARGGKRLETRSLSPLLSLTTRESSRKQEVAWVRTSLEKEGEKKERGVRQRW